MNVKWVLVLAGLMSAHVVQAADTSSGSIQVCRLVAAVDMYKAKPIDVPKGATFGDAGSMRSPDNWGGAFWPLWIATTESTTIEVANLCTMVRARVAGNLDHHRIRSADGRLFVPSSAGRGTLPDWPGNITVVATATGDFN